MIRFVNSQNSTEVHHLMIKPTTWLKKEKLVDMWEFFLWLMKLLLLLDSRAAWKPKSMEFLTFVSDFSYFLMTAVRSVHGFLVNLCWHKRAFVSVFKSILDSHTFAKVHFVFRNQRTTEVKFIWLISCFSWPFSATIFFLSFFSLSFGFWKGCSQFTCWGRLAPAPENEKNARLPRP